MTQQFCRWEKEYELRLETVDRQHQEIVLLINMLHLAVKSGDRQEIVARLANLIAVEKTHCAAEEALLQQYHYPGLSKQSKDHSEILRELESIKRGVEERIEDSHTEIAVRIRDRIISHIIGADRAYGEYLRDQGAK